jgi:hypothetical protein
MLILGRKSIFVQFSHKNECIYRSCRVQDAQCRNFIINHNHACMSSIDSETMEFSIGFGIVSSDRCALSQNHGLQSTLPQIKNASQLSLPIMKYAITTKNTFEKTCIGIRSQKTFARKYVEQR